MERWQLQQEIKPNCMSALTDAGTRSPALLEIAEREGGRAAERQFAAFFSRRYE
jgi:hypothetical protein